MTPEGVIAVVQDIAPADEFPSGPQTPEGLRPWAFTVWNPKGDRPHLRDPNRSFGGSREHDGKCAPGAPCSGCTEIAQKWWATVGVKHGLSDPEETKG